MPTGGQSQAKKSSAKAPALLQASAKAVPSEWDSEPKLCTPGSLKKATTTTMTTTNTNNAHADASTASTETSTKTSAITNE